MYMLLSYIKRQFYTRITFHVYTSILADLTITLTWHDSKFLPTTIEVTNKLLIEMQFIECLQVYM